jgi:DNA-binding MltR family transcriptional regulator
VSKDEQAVSTSADLQTVLLRHTEAGNVLVVSGQIEDLLEKLLLTRGRAISNKLAKRIFAGMGPLNSLSSKIEIAYLFELIDQRTFDDLLLIKDIRNRFAHTTNYAYFSNEVIANKCKSLTTWKAGDDPQHCFYLRTLELIDLLRNRMDVFLYAKALQEEPSVQLDDGEH